ncbi:MAG TPA: tRNA pseudouridine(55) synthase TruB [Polyangiaceae bacterium]
MACGTHHGVLVVDKPSGPTSHDVVQQARRVYGTRRIGHSGTLDPLATGVLVLTLGEACKLSSYLTAQRKRYRAVVRFGALTDTLDSTGNVLQSVELTAPLDDGAVRTALAIEASRSQQSPPAHSAIKVDGVRAYRLARKGTEFALEPRPVRVHSLCMVERGFDTVTVDLEVSKGYYVRAFARDLGRALGIPAHLGALRRLASGSFGCEEAAVFPLEAAAPLIELAECARRCLPVARLSEAGAERARQGKCLSPEHFLADPFSPSPFEPVTEVPRWASLEASGEEASGEAAPGRVTAWLDGAGRVVALGREGPAGRFAVLRGFSTG